MRGIREFLNPETNRTRKTPRNDHVERGIGKGRQKVRRPSLDSSIDSLSGNPDILYRGFNKGASQVGGGFQPPLDYLKKGFERRGPVNKKISPLAHVSRTLANTPYLSGSRSLKPAAFYATDDARQAGYPEMLDRSHGRIVKTDLPIIRNYPGNRVLDLNDRKTLEDYNFPSNPRVLAFAERAQEMLVDGKIPPESIKGYYDVNHLTRDEYNKAKQHEDSFNFARKFYYNSKPNEDPHRFSFAYQPYMKYTPNDSSFYSTSYNPGAQKMRGQSIAQSSSLAPPSQNNYLYSPISSSTSDPSGAAPLYAQGGFVRMPHWFYR